MPRALTATEREILTKLSKLLGEPPADASASPARRTPLEMPRPLPLHGEPGDDTGIGDYDWGESPLVRPLGIDTEAILSTLPLDDRRQPFDPVLASQNAYYAKRHEQTWKYYVHAVEDAKRAVVASLVREANYKRLEERAAYLKEKAAAEKKRAAEEQERRAEEKAERWKPQHLRG